MYSLKVSGQIEVIKVSEFEGKKTVKVQMVNITDKNIDVLTVKLLDTEKLEEIQKNKNLLLRFLVAIGILSTLFLYCFLKTPIITGTNKLSVQQIKKNAH